VFCAHVGPGARSAARGPQINGQIAYHGASHYAVSCRWVSCLLYMSVPACARLLLCLNVADKLICALPLQVITWQAQGKGLLFADWVQFATRRHAPRTQHSALRVASVVSTRQVPSSCLYVCNSAPV